MPNLSASERWRTIDDLFSRALDVDPAEWSTFLDEHCTNDALRRAVHRLLVAAADSDSFLVGSAAKMVQEAIFEALLRTDERR